MSGLELQKAIVARLRSDAGVSALVGARVYDHIPTAPTFPYISIGPEDITPERGDCGYNGSDIVLQLDAWSRDPGFKQVKQIQESVRAALTDAPLTLTGHRLVDISILQIRTLRDEDGATSHAVIPVRALTEPV